MPFLSLPFRAFSRLLPPVMLARKSHLKIPLFIPSIFPMRWLLAYVEGQDSNVVGRGTKTKRDKRGIISGWRKVSWICSLYLQLFTLFLTNRSVSQTTRSAPSLTRLLTTASTILSLLQSMQRVPGDGTSTRAPTPPHSTPRPPGSSPSWSNLCSPQSAKEFCASLLFQTYPHREHPQARGSQDACCSSAYEVSHLKQPGIHPLCFAVFLKKITKLSPNKMQWNEMESGYFPWNF